MPTREKIHSFFEKPETRPAKAVQFFILILILISVGLVIAEHLYQNFFLRHREFILLLEHLILVVFTVEYAARLVTAPKLKEFVFKPLNIVDFMAVFPNYLELIFHVFINTTGLRVLRLIRLLRFSRVLRLLKLFRHRQLFGQVFQYRNTILQSISPVILIFAVVKFGVWALEHFGLWIENPNLGELFAIIGFALGIILSQKIASTYEKFVQVEEASVRIYGSLSALCDILNQSKPGVGNQLCKTWARKFLALLEDPLANNSLINLPNREFYAGIYEFERTPADLSVMYTEITRDAAYCLSKKVRITPKPYDTLLQQSTIVYLFLIATFIPGLTGLISVLSATYILYGMYNLTQDLDSVLGGEFHLVNIDLDELREFAN
jgi:hypothetical protein